MADVGGLIGLFLGLSIMNFEFVVQILARFFRRLFCSDPVKVRPKKRTHVGIVRKRWLVFIVGELSNTPILKNCKPSSD